MTMDDGGSVVCRLTEVIRRDNRLLTEALSIIALMRIMIDNIPAELNAKIIKWESQISQSGRK